MFALRHLLDFRFAPRIHDLGDTKLCIPKGDAAYAELKSMHGGMLNIQHVRPHWDETLQLATLIQQGTVTAWPLPCAELGRIQRTLFILDWMQSVELLRRVHAELNKSEARNALARAVFFKQLATSATPALSTSATAPVASIW